MTSPPTEDPLVRHLLALGGQGDRQKQDRAALAVLRRGLTGHAGARVAMARHVEPYLGAEPQSWTRQSGYQVAALYAQHPEHRPGLTFAEALRILHRKQDESEALPKRFMAILEADAEDLPIHLRHTMSLLAAAGQGLDFAQLRKDLSWWGHPNRRVQERWAQDFWRQAQRDTNPTPDSADHPSPADDQAP